METALRCTLYFVVPEVEDPTLRQERHQSLAAPLCGAVENSPPVLRKAAQKLIGPLRVPPAPFAEAKHLAQQVPAPLCHEVGHGTAQVIPDSNIGDGFAH